MESETLVEIIDCLEKFAKYARNTLLDNENSVTIFRIHLNKLLKNATQLIEKQSFYADQVMKATDMDHEHDASTRNAHDKTKTLLEQSNTLDFLQKVTRTLRTTMRIVRKKLLINSNITFQLEMENETGMSGHTSNKSNNSSDSSEIASQTRNTNIEHGFPTAEDLQSCMTQDALPFLDKFKISFKRWFSNLCNQQVYEQLLYQARQCRLEVMTMMSVFFTFMATSRAAYDVLQRITEFAMYTSNGMGPKGLLLEYDLLQFLTVLSFGENLECEEASDDAHGGSSARTQEGIIAAMIPSFSTLPLSAIVLLHAVQDLLSRLQPAISLAESVKTSEREHSQPQILLPSKDIITDQEDNYSESMHNEFIVKAMGRAVAALTQCVIVPIHLEVLLELDAVNLLLSLLSKFITNSFEESQASHQESIPTDINGNSDVLSHSSNEDSTGSKKAQYTHLIGLIYCLTLMVRHRLYCPELEVYCRLIVRCQRVGLVEFADLLLRGLAAALRTTPEDKFAQSSHIDPTSSSCLGFKPEKVLLDYSVQHSSTVSSSPSFLRLEVSSAALASPGVSISCRSPFCADKLSRRASAKVSGMTWNLLSSSPESSTSIQNKDTSPWEDWLGVGVSVWVKTGRRVVECSAVCDPLPEPPKSPLTSQKSATYIVCGITLRTTTSTGSASQSKRPKLVHHLVIQIRSNRLEVVLSLADADMSANNEADVFNIGKKKWMSTVVFPSLPDVSDDTWHHICFGVIPQRGRGTSRITVWLDGLSASCVTPKAEPPPVPPSPPTDPATAPSAAFGEVKSSIEEEEAQTIVSVIVSAEANRSPASSTPTIFALDVGPLLVLNQPISLAHVAMVLYAAGPGYTGVFVGEQGDGSVSLHPSRCCYSLLEAMEKKSALEVSSNATTSSITTNQTRNRASATAPAIGAYTDVEPGPLLHPHIAIGCNQTQLLLSMSSRWQKSSVSTHVCKPSESFMRDGTSASHVAVGLGMKPYPIALSGHVIASSGASVSACFLQFGSRSMTIFMALLSVVKTPSSLALVIRVISEALRSSPPLREVCVTEHFYVVLMSLLERKATENLFSAEVAVELGKLCCCECITKKKHKRVEVTKSLSAVDKSEVESLGGSDRPSVAPEMGPLPASAGGGAEDLKDPKGAVLWEASRDVLLVDPPMLSLLLSCYPIWTNVNPQCVIALMDFLMASLLCPGNSCGMFNRRQLMRARAVRALVGLMLEQSLHKKAFLSVLGTIDCIISRDFASSEDLLQLVNIAASLTMAYVPLSNSSNLERNGSFGEAPRCLRESPPLSQFGYNTAAAGHLSSDTEDDVTGRRGDDADGSNAVAEEGGLFLTQLLRKRHAVCALLTHAANTSHLQTVTGSGFVVDSAGLSTPPSTSNSAYNNASSSNSTSTNISSFNALHTKKLADHTTSLGDSNTEDSRESVRLRGQMAMSMLINTYSFSKILYIIFQFSDIAPTKHQFASSYGPVRALPKRRDPVTGLLTLQMLCSQLPHIPGSSSRTARSEWGTDLEICLPGLFTSLLVHGGGATDELQDDITNEFEGEQSLVSIDLSKDLPNRLSRRHEARDKSVILPIDDGERGSLPMDKADVDIDSNDDREDDVNGDGDGDESRVGRHPSPGRRLSLDGSETSSVSSCHSALANAPLTHSPCTFLPLRDKTKRRSNTSSSKSSSSTGWDARTLEEGNDWFLYYTGAAAAVEVAEDSDTEALIILLAETVIDLLLGSAGSTAAVGGYLLRGWNVKDLEPSYSHPHESPAIPLPNYVGLCGGVALGAFLAVTREAARCSTQASLLYSRTDITLKYGSWPHPELEQMCNLSTSFCVTLLCCLSTILRGDSFSVSDGKEADRSEEEAVITNVEDFEVLLQGIIQIFFAAARAKFLEALGPHGNLLEILRVINAEDNDASIPNEVIYACCGSTIGRLCVQQMTCLTVSQSIRGSKGLDWETLLACLPVPMFPPIPRVASSAISLILNAAVRRRHAVAMSYLAIGVAPKVVGPGEVPEPDLERKILSFLHTSSIMQPSMSQQVTDVIIMEIDLDRNTAGGIGNPTGRVFVPIKGIFELCRRVLSESKRLRDLDKEKEREKMIEKESSNSKASSTTSTNVLPATLTASGLKFASSLSSSLTSSLQKNLSITASRLLARSNDNTQKESGSSQQQTSAQPAPTPGLQSTSSTPSPATSNSAVDIIPLMKPSAFADFFWKPRAASTKSMPPPRDFTIDIDHAVGLARLAFCQLVEEYMDNTTMLLQNLTFLLEWVDIILAWRRSVKEEEEMQFVGYLVWRLHSLLYDDHSEVQSLTMRIWSLLLRSTLGTAVRTLLLLCVPHIPGAIDLWSYDSGGFSLLYVDLDVLIANQKNEIHEAILQFQAWLGSLSADVRETFSDKLDNVSLQFRNLLKVSFENTTKSLSKKWHQHRSKLIATNELLISRLHKSHSRRRKESKESQAVEVQRQRRWRIALTNLRLIGVMRLNLMALNRFQIFSFTNYIASIAHDTNNACNSSQRRHGRASMKTPSSLSSAITEGNSTEPHEITTNSAIVPNTDSWMSTIDSTDLKSSIKAHLQVGCGLTVLGDDEERILTQGRGELMSIISLRSCVGEWGADPRIGANFMRRRLRRTNLAIVRVRDPEHSLSLDRRPSRFAAAGDDSTRPDGLSFPIPTPTTSSVQDKGTGPTHDTHLLPSETSVPMPVLSTTGQGSSGSEVQLAQPDSLESVDGHPHALEELIGSTAMDVAVVETEETKADDSSDVRPVASSSTTGVEEGLDKIKNKEKKSSLSNTVQRQPGAVQDVRDEVLPFLSPGEKLTGRFECSQVAGMDSYICEIFLGSKLFYMVAMNAVVVHDESLGDELERDSRLKSLLYVQDEGHLFIDPPATSASGHDFEIWLPWTTTQKSSGTVSQGSSLHGLSEHSSSASGKENEPHFPTNSGVVQSAKVAVVSAAVIPPKRYLQQWKYSEAVAIHRRRYLLAHVGIEVFWTNGRSTMLVFSTVKMREEAAALLLDLCPAVHALDEMSNLQLYGVGTATAFECEDSSPLSLPLPALSATQSKKTGSVSGAISMPSFSSSSAFATKSGFDQVTESWVAGSISNFDYLMYLNILAGRTFSDWSQYPIMPWVIKDYTSKEIDLSDHEFYRDLSKPMGAQSVVREREARSKYALLLQEYESETENSPGNAVPPFHFGTHFASSAIVMHYLIRLQPFSSHALVLQKGRFDQPERLFSSINQSWLSSSGGVTRDPFTATTKLQDVKELIPEFFYLPEFLNNINGYDFGVTANGLVVDDVELPPWANNSPREFIRINREALESPYVSSNLHNWIDLIFGYKQKGRFAEESCNVYHFLSYEGGVDLTSLKHGPQRQAYEQQIRDFGQTPTQLFKQPHPQRKKTYSSVYSTPTGPLTFGNKEIEEEPMKMSGLSTAPTLMLTSAHVDGLYGRLSWLSRTAQVVQNGDFSSIPGQKYATNSTNIHTHDHISGSDSVDVGGLVKSINCAIGQIKFFGADILAIPTDCMLLPGRQDVLLQLKGSGHPSSLNLAWHMHSVTPKSAAPTNDSPTADVSTSLPPGWVVVRSFDLVDKVGQIKAITLSEGGRFLITAHASTPAVYVWKVSIPHLCPAPTLPAATSTSTSSLNVDNTADVFDLEYCLTSPMSTGIITVVAASVTHDLLLVGSEDGTVFMWTLSTLQCKQLLREFTLSAVIGIVINRVNGDFFIATAHSLYVLNLNGSLIAMKTELPFANKHRDCPSTRITCVASLSISDTLQCNDGVLVGCSTGTLFLFSLDSNTELVDEAQFGHKKAYVGAVDDASADEISDTEVSVNKTASKDGSIGKLMEPIVLEEVLTLRWHTDAFDTAISAIAAKPVVGSNGGSIRVCAGSVGGHTLGWEISLSDGDPDTTADLSVNIDLSVENPVVSCGPLDPSANLLESCDERKPASDLHEPIPK